MVAGVRKPDVSPKGEIFYLNCLKAMRRNTNQFYLWACEQDLDGGDIAGGVAAAFEQALCEFFATLVLSKNGTTLEMDFAKCEAMLNLAHGVIGERIREGFTAFMEAAKKLEEEVEIVAPEKRNP